MLEKQIVIDRIEVTRDGHIQVRTATLFVENEIELAKTYSRHVLSPGDNLTGQDARVVAVAQAVWTDEVVTKYEDSQREDENEDEDDQGEDEQ